MSTGLKDILIPIKSEADLYALEPNFEEVKKVSKHYEVVGMHLYTLMLTKLFVGISRHYTTLMKKLRLGPLMVLWPVIFIKITTYEKKIMYLNRAILCTRLPKSSLI